MDESAPKAMQVIFGSRAVAEAMLAGKDISRIYIQNQIDNELANEVRQLARERQIPVSKVQRDFFEKYKGKNHQGIVAETSLITFSNLEEIVTACFEQGRYPLILILDHIVDVRNFGAICRTAEIAGVDAVVIPFDGAAKINEDAAKTAAGALSYLPICRSQSLIQTLVYLKECGISIAAANEKAPENIYESDLSGPLALMMGSEEKGIARVLMKYTDIPVKIPQYGHIDSLNVSVACGIILFEVIRQRNFFNA